MFVRLPAATTGKDAGRPGSVVNTEFMRYAEVKSRLATGGTKSWHVVVTCEPLPTLQDAANRVKSLAPGFAYISKEYSSEQEAWDALDKFYAEINVPMIAESFLP